MAWNKNICVNNGNILALRIKNTRFIHYEGETFLIQWLEEKDGDNRKNSILITYSNSFYVGLYHYKTYDIEYYVS